MNFKESINDFVTCEVHMNGSVNCFAKLGNGNWVAVGLDGNLDGAEMAAADFVQVLETLESIGANIRFTNHSAA